MDNIPVSIVSGYLGAGKTTLVNHLLRFPAGRRLAVLVNEFGDLAIDADLIEAQEDDMISLAGGCVCCSYGSGLIEAFLKLKALDPLPDHIILEASGVAIPSAIAGSLSLIDRFELDSIVCLVDASEVKNQVSNQYLADTIERQLTDADIIVINKSDLISSPELSRLNTWLSQMVTRAIIIETEYARAACDIVLQSFEKPEKNSNKLVGHHDSAYQSQVIIPERPVEPKAFVEKLLEETPNLLRAKGFVISLDGEMKTIQVVGRQTEITNASPKVKPGVVVITLNTDRKTER